MSREVTTGGFLMEPDSAFGIFIGGIMPWVKRSRKSKVRWWELVELLIILAVVGLVVAFVLFAAHTIDRPKPEPERHQPAEGTVVAAMSRPASFRLYG